MPPASPDIENENPTSMSTPPSAIAQRKASRKKSAAPTAGARRRTSAGAAKRSAVNDGAQGERRRPGRKPDPLGREKLLNAAALAFMDRGYVGTSIDDIADRLGATKGFFYHHFSSKAELYFGVIDNAMTRFDEVVRPAFKQALAPDAKLRAMAEQHALAIMSNFPGAKVGVQGLEKSLLQSGGATERRMLASIIALRDEYESMFSGTIRAGIKAGLFRDEPVGLATRGVLGALNWMTLWYNPDRLSSAAKRRAIAGQLALFVSQGLKP
jgi:AcrR family transcriptional regulator